MAWFIPSSRYIIMVVALTLGISINPLEQAQAQPLTSSLSSKLESAFRAPSGSGAPINTQSGGTRGPCMRTNKPLIALVPTYGMGKTIAESPTIYWYVPPLSIEGAPAPMIEFVLKDANDQEVYSAKYPLMKSPESVVGTPGIMSLSIGNLYPLKIGQEYHYLLTLRCDANSQDNSENAYAEGRLQRVAPNPNFEHLTQQATPQERVSLYADNELWYETVATLIELRRDRPYDTNLVDAWEKLLSLVQKGDIVAKEPLFNGARNINN